MRQPVCVPIWMADDGKYSQLVKKWIVKGQELGVMDSEMRGAKGDG